MIKKENDCKSCRHYTYIESLGKDNTLKNIHQCSHFKRDLKSKKACEKYDDEVIYALDRLKFWGFLSVIGLVLVGSFWLIHLEAILAGGILILLFSLLFLMMYGMDYKNIKEKNKVKKSN